VATARDKATIDRRSKNLAPENAAVRLHSSTVQHHSATVRASSTRGAPMMKLSSRAAATAFASLLMMSFAFAQTPAPATPAPADKMAPAKKAGKPRSAASLECSKEADTKGVHGKERKKFMSDCKKEAKDAAAKPKT